MLITVLFYLFGAVLVGAALGMILSRNPVHSAFSLVVCFVTSAGIWLLIEAEFLAVVLVLVYVGAVMVLFLFVVMMLDINIEELRRGFTRYAWLGGLTAVIVILEIAGVVTARKMGVDVHMETSPLPIGYSNTRELGSLLYTDYAYPFELAAILLLVAIVAAIALTMRHRAGRKVQDANKKFAVRREDRVRIVKMEAEKKE
jgi:NADH-quinone oxidoreductase subunit J